MTLKTSHSIPCVLRLTETSVTVLVLPTDSLNLSDMAAIGFQVDYSDIAKNPKKIFQSIASDALELQKLLDLPAEAVAQ